MTTELVAIVTLAVAVILLRRRVRNIERTFDEREIVIEELATTVSDVSVRMDAQEQWSADFHDWGMDVNRVLNEIEDEAGKVKVMVVNQPPN